ncbi:hypothetical protein A2973_02845 [Candidatus Gottesmanbacteria bacterium RIFCSPLOWO2_01_FULL_49_10]|uniref:Uncharacterized protein n=1 Tax=Candidatus Gottesmanbacteria bacterium RIFCSPLOWO2_01_FULL_49_10 TaxID=1798396 RepID=A0A1F6AXV0_9BACT|nr:MAG: hypothetical protein A2973_02845 [Candidatus Gottesmanbacteria bacterium RIFCSPLOWO2_01_FULL_49_10]
MEGRDQKLRALQGRLDYYQQKLETKMKRYRGVIHESASSEMKHQEVMVLRAMVSDLKREILSLGKDP